MSAISITPHFMGLATALQRDVLFHVAGRPTPDWLHLGSRRQCYANSDRQLLSRAAANDYTVHHAGGYVIDLVGIPTPFEHVPFVLGDARIDPTLPNPRECLHFGITTANIAAALGPRDVARAAACLVDAAAGRGEHDPVHLCRYIDAVLFDQVACYPLDRPDTSAPPRSGPS
jgi:hypothetical protein